MTTETACSRHVFPNMISGTDRKCMTCGITEQAAIDAGRVKEFEGMEKTLKSKAVDTTDRDAFEKIAKDHFIGFDLKEPFVRHSRGHYLYGSVEGAYQLWKAARDHYAPQLPLALQIAGRILERFAASEEGKRPKIEEWEACYAMLFTQMNYLLIDARVLCAPRLTQYEVADVIAAVEHHEDKGMYITKIVAALKAAGVKFKEE
jgi:hypothetical protein